MITTERLTANVGAEVIGVDCDRLVADEAIPGLILDALEEHGVLVFRGLFPDDATQVAFAKRMGRVDAHPDRPIPEVTTISLDPSKSPIAEYLQGTFDWHIDGTTDDIPNKATILTAHAVAESGGETEFASTYGAFEALTDEEKNRFEKLEVVHSLAASQRRSHPDPTPEQMAAWERRPSRRHPLVWRHRSGRRSLVIGITAAGVVQMDEDEGLALLDDLLDRSTAPDRMYRHEWQVGDMVIWDNCGVLHRACPYDASSTREMHRSVLLGDEPIG